MNSTIKEAASRLYEAELNKTECLPVRELIGIDTINEAYEVQNLNTIRRLKSGARLIGCFGIMLSLFKNLILFLIITRLKAVKLRTQ